MKSNDFTDNIPKGLDRYFSKPGMLAYMCELEELEKKAEYYSNLLKRRGDQAWASMKVGAGVGLATGVYLLNTGATTESIWESLFFLSVTSFVGFIAPLNYFIPVCCLYVSDMEDKFKKAVKLKKGYTKEPKPSYYND